MKIIDRTVGFGIFLTTFFGVLVLSLILVLGNIFKELLDILINNPDVPITTVLAFMALVLPFSLTFTIPWGFLTALLLVFGRMSADNELIALKSNGVSVPRICVPAFLLAIALTLICFWINIEVAPRAEQAMTRAVVDIATSNPASLFRADEVVDKFPDRRVYVGKKEGNQLFNIIVFELTEEFVPKQMIYAREGVLTTDPKNGSRLLLRLFNARFEQRDDKDPRDVAKIRQGIVMEEGVFPISLEKFFEEFQGSRRLSSYTLPELTDLMLKGAGDRQTEVVVEFNKRFSVSLACAAFVLIAIPFGITAHRKETSVGFGLSLIIAFTYFFFIIMADTFRNNPAAHPALLIWVPNVLFFCLGSYLFYRLSKR
ncbi:MAG: LptF/LptG family permease [Chthoniobacterales bacterium]|nr:LptF/LptG family permease [Chthoniobacterales bacterium]